MIVQAKKGSCTPRPAHEGEVRFEKKCIVVVSDQTISRVIIQVSTTSIQRFEQMFGTGIGLTYLVVRALTTDFPLSLNDFFCGVSGRSLSGEESIVDVRIPSVACIRLLQQIPE